MRASSRLVLAAILAAGSASANPRPLPYTYAYDTLPEGDLEVEQYADMTPLRALNASNGAPVWYAATQFQTELEYGITSRLELGVYLTLAPTPGDAFTSSAQMPLGNGLKQRLKLRLAEEGEWPLDVALYGEIAENQREIELEAKIIFQRRLFERMRIIANAWVERELYYDGRAEWVLNPTAGLTYQVTPTFQPGIEYWMRAEYLDTGNPPNAFNLGPHHFFGPTMLLSFGKLWWTTGVYMRASDVGHTMQAGDAFGRVWVRTVLGFGI